MEVNGINIPSVSPRFCYVLIKPDVILRNILKDTLNYFEDLGLQLIDYRCGALDKALYSTMYEPSFKWELDFWSHNAKAYKFGPVIGMVFWNLKFPRDYPSAQIYLSSIKGSTLPGNLEPGTLRYELKSSNRVFNLVHISDTAKQALIESSSWFGAEKVKSMLTGTTKHRRIKYARLVAGEIGRHGYPLDRRLSGWLSYTLVKIRILHAIKKQADLPASLSQIVSTLEGHYHEFSQELLVLSEKRLTAKVENDHLRTLIKKGALSKEIRQLFEVILDINCKKKTLLSTLEFFWYLILKWKVYVSDLERYLIDSVLRYPARLPPTVF